MSAHKEWSALSAYLDGELPYAERLGMETHLASCASCRSELESLGRTKKWASCAPRRALPPELFAELESHLRRPSWREIVAAVRQWPVFWLPAGAAITAALVLALWHASRSPEDDYVPLAPLLAAHSRYVAESLVPGDLVASNFSSQIAAYHGDQ